MNLQLEMKGLGISSLLHRLAESHTTHTRPTSHSNVECVQQDTFTRRLRSDRSLTRQLTSPIRLQLRRTLDALASNLIRVVEFQVERRTIAWSYLCINQGVVACVLSGPVKILVVVDVEDVRLGGFVYEFDVAGAVVDDGVLARFI